MVQVADHHVETHGPHLLHVLPHDPVAPLGHPRHVLTAVERSETQAEEDDAELLGDFLALVQVGIHLATGFMERLQGRAGEFHLAARFQGDVLIILLQPDDVVSLHERLPAESLQLLEDDADAVGSIVGKRRAGDGVVGELLVLRADPPLLGRLASRFQMLDELAAGRDRRGVLCGRYGHGR